MRAAASDWPIGAALIQFPRVGPGGVPSEDASPDVWARVFREVAAAGFDHVDITDSWLRPGDLEPERLQDLARTIKEAGLGVTAISTARRSILDPEPDVARANLAYALRTVQAAAVIGTRVVCVGLHRPLTPEQLAAQWFWTEPGGADPIGDSRVWDLAVTGFRSIGSRAADLGVDVSLELYEDTLLGTTESAVRLVRDVGLANVGLNPDVGNLVRVHGPIEDWEQVLCATLPLANYWHIKNYYRDHDPATGSFFTVPAPAESGVINYRRAIELALDAGFAGPICVEHYGGDGLSVSASNREYLRRILAAKLDGRP